MNLGASRGGVGRLSGIFFVKSVDLVDVGNVGNLIGFSVVVGLLIVVVFIGLIVGRSGKSGNLGVLIGVFHGFNVVDVGGLYVVGLTVGRGLNRGHLNLDASTWARF